MGGLPIAGDSPAFDFRQITVDVIQQCFGEEKSTVRVTCLTDYVITQPGPESVSALSVQFMVCSSRQRAAEIF